MRMYLYNRVERFDDSNIAQNFNRTLMDFDGLWCDDREDGMSFNEGERRVS